MSIASLSRDEILMELEKILTSSAFLGAGRSTVLLRFLVEQSLGGESERLKEYTVGAEGLGKGESFDPRTDPIVRAEASRLRGRLDRYYATEGHDDPIVISIPKGSYAPLFGVREAGQPEPRSASSAASRGESPGRTRLLWFAAGAAGTALALALLWTWMRPAPFPPPSLVQVEVELLSSGASLGSDLGCDVILSPDGTRMVFVARARDGATYLNSRRLDEGAVRVLRGTEGARAPFFSPDGQWVGFWSSGKVKKTPVEGGSPLDLAVAIDLQGASWAGDGTIIAAIGGGKLARIPSSPGAATIVADFSGEGAMPAWPQVLPDGTSVLFTNLGSLGPNNAKIEVLSLPGGKRKTIVEGGTYGRYLADGTLTYVNQGTLFAVAFDPKRLETEGVPVPVLEDVAYSSTFGFAQIDVSGNGTLVYRRDAGGGRVVPTWLDRSGGRGEGVLARGGHYAFPRIAPDGARLAMASTESGTSYVGVYESDREISRWPTKAGTYGLVWTPDGRALVFGGWGGLSWVRPDDPAPPRPLTRAGRLQVPFSFSPDGKRLAYHELGPSSHLDLWTVPIAIAPDGALVAGKAELLLRTTAYESYPSFSPDGRWLAYGSSHTGRVEIYVRAFPDDGATPVQVSRGGGRIARWLPTGTEILYRTDDQRLMVAAYSVNGSSIEVEPPQEWSPLRLGETGVLANYDVHPDGKRVLGLLAAARPEERQSPNHVTVKFNFFEELRRRLHDTK